MSSRGIDVGVEFIGEGNGSVSTWEEIPPPRTIIRATRGGRTIKVPKPVIVIDSREGDYVYTFERFRRWIAGTERRALPVGDYSIDGLEGVVAVERKSVPDAIQSVMPPQRAGFLARCERMAAFERAAIVIEGSYGLLRSSYEWITPSRAHPNAVVGSYLAIQERWGIPVHFVDSPPLAEELVAHILTKFHVRRWLREAGHGDHFQDGDI